MIQKTNEYWLALSAMVIYVIVRDSKDTLPRRVAKTAASAMLTVGVSADFAMLTGMSDRFSAIVLMAAGLTLIDTVTAIVADKQLIKDILMRRLGK